MKLLLKVSVVPYAEIDLKKTTLKIKDGTGTPNEVEIKLGDGNFTWTENRDIEYTPDRGILDEVKENDEQPMDISFEFKWDYIEGSPSSGALPTVYEAIKGIGNASSWISTDPDACRPFAVDIEIFYDPTPSTCGDEEIITFPDFRYDDISPDLREAQISATGRCNATAPTIVRQANS